MKPASPVSNSTLDVDEWSAAEFEFRLAKLEETFHAYYGEVPGLRHGRVCSGEPLYSLSLGRYRWLKFAPVFPVSGTAIPITSTFLLHRTPRPHPSLNPEVGRGDLLRYLGQFADLGLFAYDGNLHPDGTWPSPMASWPGSSSSSPTSSPLELQWLGYWDSPFPSLLAYTWPKNPICHRFCRPRTPLIGPTSISSIRPLTR